MDTSRAIDHLLSAPPSLPIRRVVRPPAAADPDTPALDESAPGEPAPAAGLPTVPAGVWFALALRAHQLRLSGALDRLIAPDLLADRLQPHPHQLRVAERVLREKAPAALLADEVGLGKTIEAGLVLKELVLRDLVRSALVVAPRALLTQWQDELRERFDEDFVLADERRFRGFETEERVICSFGQLVSASARIGGRPWDCLIVDEAHLLANPAARRRRAVAALQTRWRLLLTATPIQNKITDLYSLVDLVAPGRLGTLRQFVATYAADPATCRAVVPDRLDDLRAIADEVMCRTRRADAGIPFAPRRVETYLVSPAPPEAALMRDATAYLRALYRRGLAAWSAAPARPAQSHTRGRARPGAPAAPLPPPAHERAPGVAVLPPSPTGRGTGGEVQGAGGEVPSALIREIVALQQSLSSSPQALAASFRARAERHPEERADLLALAARCDDLTGAKERLLLDALAGLGDAAVLVFTLRLETARRLRDVIAATGRSCACYTGRLDAGERRDVIARFDSGALATLVATDAGAEGLNLQRRCHVVFNYDLHWNPMKMEQRIGRVHRLGQAAPVTVANFALADTIDEYVLALLYQKIDLFTMTIGAIETVLADVQDGELDLEERILEVLLRGERDEDVRAGLDSLGDQLAAAAGRLSAAESLTAGVLG